MYISMLVCIYITSTNTISFVLFWQRIGLFEEVNMEISLVHYLYMLQCSEEIKWYPHDPPPHTHTTPVVFIAARDSEKVENQAFEFVSPRHHDVTGCSKLS